MNATKGIKTYFYFAKQYPAKTTLVISALVICAFAELLGIGLLLPLVGKLMSSTETNAIITKLPFEPSFANLLIILVVAIIIKSIILYVGLRYAGFISTQITYDFRKRLITALMKAKWPYYISQPVGQIATALAEESARAGSGYLLGCKAFACIALIGAYFIASLFISWKICIAAIMIGGLMAYFLKSYVRKARDAGYEITTAMQTLIGRMITALEGAKPVRAMHLEKPFLEIVDRELNTVFNAQKTHINTSQLVQIIYEPVAVLAIAVGLYWVVTYGSVSISEAFVMAFLFYRLMGQLNLLQNHYQNMVHAESAVWNILSTIKKAENAEEKLFTGTQPSLGKSITFDNVSFAHEGQTALLTNINATIHAHKINVIFGPSGKGKTTLVDMILGFYSPVSGKILLDGKPLEEHDLLAWRSKIGYVPQETYLFNESIQYNITMGDKTVIQAQVDSALKQAAADEFVQNLTGKTEYNVGEKGGRLSGGQRQRIAIARAIVNKPDLLIMDESTTGIDTEAEKLIMLALQNIKASTTILMITHNRGLLAQADNIIDLERISVAA